MKPCQVDWQKLVFQGKNYSVPEKSESLLNIKQNEKSESLLNIKQNEKSTCIYAILWPIAFASKTLSSAEQHYRNIECEVLGILHGLEKFCEQSLKHPQS